MSKHIFLFLCLLLVFRVVKLIIKVLQEYLSLAQCPQLLQLTRVSSYWRLGCPSRLQMRLQASGHSHFSRYVCVLRLFVCVCVCMCIARTNILTDCTHIHSLTHSYARSNTNTLLHTHTLSFTPTQRLKLAQNKNGLRHQDYSAYKRFCGSRVTRLRHLTGFLNRGNAPKVCECVLVCE
jgi:hypothetical protein